jgi:hypothetical protein
MKKLVKSYSVDGRKKKKKKMDKKFLFRERKLDKPECLQVKVRNQLLTKIEPNDVCVF